MSIFDLNNNEKFLMPENGVYFFEGELHGTPLTIEVESIHKDMQVATIELRSDQDVIYTKKDFHNLIG